MKHANGVDRPPGILTVDVEEWYHGHNYEGAVPASTWDDRRRTSAEGVDRLLALCDDLNVRATFFVLGWTAEREPDVIRRIATAGHEIGCHSYGHPVVYRMTPQEFREDTRRAAGVLGDIVGEPPRLYRAPSFSIVPQSYWALDVLAEEGFRIDCSLFPVKHPRYGNPGGPRTSFVLGDREGLLVCPMTTLRLGAWNIPFSGGGYLRLLPTFLLRSWTNHVLQRQDEAVVFYVHPWEFETERPDVDLGFWQNLRSQGGKADLAGKLRGLMAGARSTTLGEWSETRRVTAPVIANVGGVPGAIAAG